MKQLLIDYLSEALSNAIPKDAIDRLIEFPPSEEMGDYAFPCFSLARKFRKSPASIAAEVGEKLQHCPGIASISVVSGYLNIFVDKKMLAEQVLDDAVQEHYGKAENGIKTVVEFSSPNTNKPLHLGHLRNMAIGESVARILSFGGNDVVRVSINNDRGVHICKSMLAYQLLGDTATPDQVGKKPDHFVGDYYVLFSQKAKEDPSWDEKAQELLRKWEDGDQETVALWKKMNAWAFEGFEQTYRLFGIAFDKEYFESAIYKKGKEIVEDGLLRGVFKKRDDGAVVVDLESEKLGEKVLLRPNGTSVYIVQDLHLAELKYQEYTYDQSIYVVGNEQEYHFNVLKLILKKLGYTIGDKICHLSYGMVELPEGKMKSREGTVVDADDLVRQTQELAKVEIKERYELDESVLEERSLKIALSAVKYQLLKVDITKNMLFDPKQAIRFEGDTGPYLLYSYARASSILRKAQYDGADTMSEELSSDEIRLIKKIGQFPSIAAISYEKLSPAFMAAYAFELSQIFNEFYHKCQVIGSDQEAFRLRLVNTFRIVLKKCIRLLGIEEIEEM